jgi:hypothetical protein
LGAWSAVVFTTETRKPRRITTETTGYLLLSFAVFRVFRVSVVNRMPAPPRAAA